MKKLSTAGDTIIEVLLALTVVSTMLGGAYVLANRSLNGNRESQERGEALKIGETQVERLKSVIDSGSNSPYTNNDVFCINSSNAVRDANSPTISMGSLPALDADNFASYTASCTSSAQGLPYYVSIERSTSDNNQFTIRTRWDRLGVEGHNEVQLIYRVYP